MNPITNNPPTPQDFLNFKNSLPATKQFMPAALSNTGQIYIAASAVVPSGNFGSGASQAQFIQTQDGNWWTSNYSWAGAWMPTRISQADIQDFQKSRVNPFNVLEDSQDYYGFMQVATLLWIISPTNLMQIANADTQALRSANSANMTNDIVTSVATAAAFLGGGVAASELGGATAATTSTVSASNAAGAGGFSLAEGGNAGLTVTAAQATEGTSLLGSMYSGAENLVTGSGLGTQAAKTAAGLVISKYEQSQQVNTAKQIAAINAAATQPNIFPMSVAPQPASNSPITGISKTELEIGAAALLTVAAAKMFILP